MPNDFISFAEFEEWLYNEFGNEKFHPGLERLEKVFHQYLNYIKNPNAKVIIVAGTNGKGETVHFLKEILKRNNLKFLAFTSPHMLSIKERFEGSIGQISLAELNSCHKVLYDSRESLTYYEYLFGVFILWAERQNLDYLLLEVGLGGRLDAVNLFDADISLLTSISRDHQEFLGNRLRDILKEKYGVTRPGKRLISNLESQYLNGLLKNWCQQDQVTLECLQQRGMGFSYQNYLLASQALKDLKHVRFEELPKRSMIGEIPDLNITLYGAHNVDGVRKLVQKLQDKTYNFHTTLLAFSKRSQQDIMTMIRILKSCPITANIVLTDFSHAKASPVKKLAEQLDIPYEQNWKDYLQKHDRNEILATGSYYFISEVLDFVNGDTSIKSS